MVETLWHNVSTKTLRRNVSTKTLRRNVAAARLKLELPFVGDDALVVVFDKAQELAFEALEFFALDGFGARGGILGDKDDEAARVIAVHGFPHFGKFQPDAIDLRHKFAGDKAIVRFLYFVGNVVFQQEFDGWSTHGCGSVWD